MRNNALFYILTILIFGIALWFVLVQGKALETGRIDTQPITGNTVSVSQHTHFLSNVESNIRHPLAILIIQILCIMITARIFGYGMTKIGQPSVIGEIVAGIILGPSLLGILFPEFSDFLFPEESLKRLHVLSQIGLVLFMFIVGMELDIGEIKKKAQAAVIVSHASIIFPYFLGVALAYFLYPLYAPDKVSFIAFALFMGIAMSITAFPVLARIVQERNMAHTPIGTLVITCAAADDITAWCLLALVIAIVSAGGMMGAVGSIVLSVIYILLMWFIVKPVLRRVAVKYDTPESINKTVVAVIFGILLLSCYLTEIMGIHALFGAFLAGIIMPAQKEFKRILSEKIEDVSLVLLLPLFFVFTGLRTEISLLHQTHVWGVCFLIIGVAILGKFAGSAVAAKFVGQTWKESLLIGALMNTRGLMELVVLNIGYDLGILSPEIFTMMVLMALVTTFMTGPAIRGIEYLFRFEDQSKEKEPSAKEFNALLSFGSPASGGRLLEVADYLNLKNEKDSSVTAVHFSPGADISMLEAEQNEKEAFLPIHRTADRLGISLKKVFKVTDNVEREIIRTVKERPCDILLVGSSRELFTDDKTGGKIRNLICRLDCGVGVFIDKGVSSVRRLALVISDSADLFLVKYGLRYLEGNDGNHLTIIDKNNVFRDDQRLPGGKFKKRIIIGDSGKEKSIFPASDLVMISYPCWQRSREKEDLGLSQGASVLIISK